MISKRLGLLLIAVFSATAQTWTGDGSTGAVGAFVLTATDPRIVNGIFIFDPVRDNLDVNGTNIYNFTQITIPYNVTVQIRANKLRTPGPIVWLSSGPVLIAGVVNVSGNNGHDATASLSVRTPSEPGPRRLPGGAGAKPGDVPQPGFGPGGGVAPAGTGSGGCSAGFATAYLPSAGGYYGAASRCTGGGCVYRQWQLATIHRRIGRQRRIPRVQRSQYRNGRRRWRGSNENTSDVDYAPVQRHLLWPNFSNLRERW